METKDKIVCVADFLSRESFEEVDCLGEDKLDFSDVSVLALLEEIARLSEDDQRKALNIVLALTNKWV